MKELVRSKIVPQMRKELAKLGPALIAEHGKDIQHAPGENPSKGFAAPTYHPQTSKAQAVAPEPKTTTTTGKVAVNTVTVHASDEFRTTAEEMYITFTDPQRIAAFTRGPPRRFDGAHVGGQFSIFDGNVTGEYLALEPYTLISQKWRLAQWPEGHFSTLEIRFDQNDIDRVTNMRVTWSGVPVGQEEVVKNNWEGYYVRSIKQTFGYASSFPTPTSSISSSLSSPKTQITSSPVPTKPQFPWTRLLMCFLVLLLGVGLARFSDLRAA